MEHKGLKRRCIIARQVSHLNVTGARRIRMIDVIDFLAENKPNQIERIHCTLGDSDRFISDWGFQIFELKSFIIRTYPYLVSSIGFQGPECGVIVVCFSDQKKQRDFKNRGFIPWPITQV